MKSPWPTKKLGEICDIKTGKKDVNEGNPNGQYPFFTCSNEITYSDTYSFDTEAILIAGNGDVGSTKYYKGKFEAYQRTYVLDQFKTGDIKFFYYFISNNIKEKLLKDKSGSTMPYIRKGDLESFEVPLPPFSIQQKIVKILDTIQEAIEVQDKIVELTKELKKSVMADLFKYGAPSFRKGRKLKKTEIGEIPEDWEVVRLNEICDVVRGGSPRPKGDPKYFSKEPTPIHWITIADLTKYKQGRFITNTDEFLTEEGKKKSRFLRKGSFVITNSGTVGIPAFLGIDGCIHDGYLALLNIARKVDKVFLYYLIDFCRPRLQQIAPKGTQANLNTIIVSNFQIVLPPLSEQQEIAEILQTIDKKIELERRKKELYEELFRTMLNKIMKQEIDVEKIEI